MYEIVNRKTGERHVSYNASETLKWMEKTGITMDDYRYYQDNKEILQSTFLQCAQDESTSN